MVVIVAEANRARVLDALTASGETPLVIGQVKASAGDGDAASALISGAAGEWGFKDPWSVMNGQE